MGETRARPAREAERFQMIVRANVWFWSRMARSGDPNMDVVQEWELLPYSVQIRRWRAAQPEEMPEDSQEATPRAL